MGNYAKGNSNLLAAGVVCSVVGLIIVIFSVSVFVYASQSTNWPTTRGTIVRSTIVEESDEGTTYYPDIGYTYSVGGQSHTSTALIVGGIREGGMYSIAQGYTDRFPEGAEVTVYYDPANPASSALIPGVQWAHAITFVVGIVFLLGGLAFFIAWFRKKKSNPQVLPAALLLPATEETRFCSGCGGQVSGNAGKCPYCGQVRSLTSGPA